MQFDVDEIGSKRAKRTPQPVSWIEESPSRNDQTRNGAQCPGSLRLRGDQSEPIPEMPPFSLPALIIAIGTTLVKARSRLHRGPGTETVISNICLISCARATLQRQQTVLPPLISPGAPECHRNLNDRDFALTGKR